MNKILLIPDIHSRTFWKKAKEFQGTIVFLGDYLDPYDFEYNPNGKYQEKYGNQIIKYDLYPDRKLLAIENFKEILNFAKSRDNVILLKGNHDYHYESEILNASRKDYKNYPEINALFSDNENLFSKYYHIDKLLLSHAGISKEWLNYNFQEDYNYEEAIKNASLKTLFQASYYRGGSYDYSGPLWLDVNEILNNDITLYTDDNIKYQVFGHTMQIEQGSIVRVNNGACIDSREIFEIDPENPEDSLKIWK